MLVPLLLSRDPPCPDQSAEPAPIPVNTVTASIGNIPKIIAGIRTVTPLQSVIVRARVDGEVIVAFDEGQTVKKGDILIRIDPRQLQAALDGAEAKRVQDEAQLTSAASDANRYRTLADKNVVSMHMAWSPCRRSNAGVLRAQHPGDYSAFNCNQLATAPEIEAAKRNVSIDNIGVTANALEVPIARLFLE